MARLNKLTTIWVKIIALFDPKKGSKKARALQKQRQALLDQVYAVEAEIEALQTEIFRAAGQCPPDMLPIYGWRYGFSAATEKADGTLIVQSAEKAERTTARTF